MKTLFRTSSLIFYNKFMHLQKNLFVWIWWIWTELSYLSLALDVLWQFASKQHVLEALYNLRLIVFLSWAFFDLKWQPKTFTTQPVQFQDRTFSVGNECKENRSKMTYTQCFTQNFMRHCINVSRYQTHCIFTSHAPLSTIAVSLFTVGKTFIQLIQR